ncbi:DinB family protein [Spirosoma sp. BT702]|uniref:DinB family protein n=1 Tax=Spirosoma profusum TaxID=2771354 RepID=A0A926XWH9_9BACT|nr:DinB family protein [Spirosoma profusum]MBD2701221.1 DinB family protein [Spirosoma profusum]
MNNQELSNELNLQFTELLRMLSSLSEEELNQVPFEGSWTAAQVGDHLSKGYNILPILSGNTEPANRPIDEKLDGIRAVFLDFSTKLESPEEIVPDGGPFEKAELIGRLTTQTQLLTSFAQHNDLTLVCLDSELPQIGTLTRYEWLSFMGIHTQRHIHQLQKIIQHLNNALLATR